MKIHIVSPYWAPFVGGAEVVAGELANWLGLRHEVTVHTSQLDRPRHGRPRFLWSADVERADGIEIRRYETLGARPLFGPGVGEADVVHFHGFYRPLFMAVALERRVGPLVLQPHGNLSRGRGGQSPFRLAVRRGIDTKVVPALAGRIGAAVYLSAEEHRQLDEMGLGSRPLLYLPGPIRRSMIELAEAPAAATTERDPDLFAVVSRLVPYKCVEHALYAAARIPSVRLAIVSSSAESDYETKLRSLVRDLGLERRVSWEQRAGSEELAHLLGRAVGTILPSKTEGWPLSVAESVLFGAVPVGTSSAVGHVTGDMGLPLLYEWGDVDELVALLRRVRDEAASFSERLARARKWVLANLTPEAAGQKLEDLYESLAGARGALGLGAPTAER